MPSSQDAVATPKAGQPIALITGASTGIGYELALLLARDGYRLVLVSRDPARLEAAAVSLRREVPGAVVETRTADLADPEETHAACAFAAGLAPDILINNAGFGGYGPFARSSVAEEQAMIATNITALTLLAKAVLPAMLERGSGRMLNVGSTASFAPGPFSAVYAATKAYVLSLSEALSEETRGSGVTVTALCPGPTHTRFADRASIGGTRAFNGPIADARSVAAEGYAALMAGKPVVVTGLVNKLLIFGARLLPRTLVARISRRELTPPSGS
ncbi:short-chain dehydrogenase [Azorhizobium oxalatiphilum]|uniref:Short-chain dehydrogenase n=1 Tax=Azorhizobium oxalatiphilum TaxID=980631 RepID=A0A917BN73_9HYPH|nr:SDR family oxidoreductase [Azorhizobium oxalatiphilum]GGF49617.1 short-chain dehydrogenase [Azorhizobium oxalatiphilum]